MKVDFERLHWENYPSTDTPLNADNLNRLEEGVAGLYSDVAEIEEELGGGIGEYVTDWLTEHVDPTGSAVVVDNTLTIEGAAADAKKTGDEITDLKNELKNGYFNAVIESGTWKDAGAVKVSQDNRIRTSELYHLNKGEYITAISGSYQHIYKVWNAGKTAMIRSDSTFSSADETYTATAECWVAVIFRLSDNSELDPSAFDGEVRIYNTLVSQVPSKLDKVMTATADTSDAHVGVALSDGSFGTRTDTRYILKSCAGYTKIDVTTAYWSTSYPAIVFYDALGNVTSTVATIPGVHTYTNLVIAEDVAMYAVNVDASNISSLVVNETFTIPNVVRQNSANIAEITESLKHIEGTLVLPEYTYGLEGFPLYLYYENVLKNGWLKDYEIANNDLQVRSECYTTTPSASGDVSIPVVLYKGLNVIESKSVTAHIAPANASGSAKVLIIGDSKSASVMPWDTLSSLLSVDANVDFTFLGTVTSGSIAREAYSGKSIVEVCDDEYISGTTPNIFYDANVTTTNGHHFSFAKGVQTLGETPDIVIIDHGANQWSKAWSLVKGCYDDVIASIHAVSANIKIVVVAQEGTGLLDNPQYITNGKWSLNNPSYTTIGHMVDEYQGRETENVYMLPQYMIMDLYRDFPICKLPSFDGADGERDFCLDNTHPGLNTGNWSASATYSRGAWVNRNGSGYGCKKANTNIDPETDDGTYWSECKNLGDGYRKKGLMYYCMLKYLMTV